MTRAQVLDVGDVVFVPIEGETGVVVAIDEPGTIAVCFEEDEGRNLRYFNLLDKMNRVGGDLQVGDFVTVFAVTPSLGLSGDKGIIVDDYEGDGFSVYLFGHLNSFSFTSDQLTRITKAEALA